jgi:hypothetical protein
MSQNPDQEKPGMSEVPVEDLFLRVGAPGLCRDSRQDCHVESDILSKTVGGSIVR